MSVPKLSLSGGPSSAGSGGESASGGTTGSFVFGGNKTTFKDVLKTAAPFLIIVGVFWLLNRKK